MPREKKAKVIDNLEQLFSRCSIGILTDYRGLSALEMTALRRRLRESSIDYKVVKNTLARIAAKRAGREELAGIFDGPVAIAFGYGDIVAPAKALAEYIQATKSAMSIKGGFLPERMLTSAEIITLSTLPSTKVLITRVLAEVQKPLVALLGYLSAPMQGVIGVLQARIKQLEGE
jgi:large subunit ribosomal protein L10